LRPNLPAHGANRELPIEQDAEAFGSVSSCILWVFAPIGAKIAAIASAPEQSPLSLRERKRRRAVGSKEANEMNIRDATEMVIREVLQRLSPEERLDPALLQEQIVKVIKQQGEAIFGQLSEADRQQLRRDGLRITEQSAHLARINETIEYGRSLIAKYHVQTLGELPHEEQLEFARCGRARREVRSYRIIETISNRR
jgi:hypothetical protein